MMKALSTRKKVVLAITAILVLAVVLVTVPILMELQSISKTKDQYLFESAVANEALGRKVNKPNAEEVLNPRFLRRHGLNLDDYLDTKGYFAPHGNHWIKWSLETKTAAILLWRERQAPSAWELRRTIHRVNEYYSQNDLNTPLMEVVNAAAGK